MFSVNSKPFVFAHCVSETPVQQDLAMTPSQMDVMRRKGVPISQSNLDGMFYEGDTNSSMDVPLDMQRGVDLGMLWQESKEAGSKLAKSRKRASILEKNLNKTDVQSTNV